MLQLAPALTVWQIHTLNLFGRCACAGPVTTPGIFAGDGDGPDSS